MIDIRDMYRHWIMHQQYSGIFNGGAITGMFIGAVVCFCINCCTSSCARKTTQIQAESSMTTSHSVDSVHADSAWSSIDTSSIQHMLSQIDELVDITWTKRTFGYDSLGNQKVTSEETATVSESRHKRDSTDMSAFASSTFVTTSADTIHGIDSMSQHEQHNKISYSTPWYYKLYTHIVCFAIGAIIMALVTLYIIKRKKSS